jgi:hypothetical protein
MNIANTPHHAITRTGRPQFHPAYPPSSLPAWRGNCNGHGRMPPAIGGAGARVAPASIRADGESRRLRARAIAKWCAGTVVLFMPGTLLVLALLWLARRYAPNGTRTS